MTDKITKEATRFEKEVRKALIEKDIRIGSFPKILGVSKQYLHDTFKENRTCSHFKSKIADYLGLDLAEIQEMERATNEGGGTHG